MVRVDGVYAIEISLYSKRGLTPDRERFRPEMETTTFYAVR
jgi:hypothetical protein